MTACQQQNNAPQTDNQPENLVDANISEKQDYNEDDPAYQENTETSEEFALSYNNGLTFSDLGLTGSKATVVTIDNCDAFGNYFYVKDENTLVISHNGAFFEASQNLN